MENLSDEEFGVKNVEEAPILIAQRYLNIFRQVHIFNKATRDKFDDELLALPENIIAFIKRMPGGRLLIEHIEEVKTDRGISFVKSRRDEFTDGTDSSTAVTTMQGMGGNVVMDSSFAETLANSLASAFKNAPIASGGGQAFSAPADMGQAFELIAEEIRASHSSLLDVLQETRNITDSVIASQVSISRILEGLLSSRSNEGGNSDLTNQIVASQASITKLLESLCNSHTAKSEKADKYFDIENRLSRFEQEMRDEVKSLLATNIAIPSHFNRENPEPQPVSPKAEKNVDVREVSVNNESGKKKKKNKNKNKEQLASVSAPVAATAALSTPADDLSHILNNVSEDDFQPIGGVIRNSDYKYEDDFSNVNLNEPPLEQTDTLDILEAKTDDLDDSQTQTDDILSGLDSLDNLDDLDLSSVDDAIISEPISEEEPVVEDEPIIEEDSLTEEAPIAVEDNLTEEIPVVAEDDLSLDSFTQDEENATPTPVEDDEISEVDNSPLEDINSDTEAGSLDDILSDEEISTAEDNIIPESENVEDIIGNTVEEDTSLAEDTENLDDIQITNAEEETNDVVEENPLNTEELDTDNISLDDLASDDTTEEEPLPAETESYPDEDIDTTPQEDEHPSRFNDTLDKIRDALTSDHIDLASLDEPIALDDYSDDENVSEEEETPVRRETPSEANSSDDEWEYEYVEDDGSSEGEGEASSEDGDWEYEYVDENGNVVTSKEGNQEGEDWEWEYVDEDQSDASSDENKPQ